MPVARRDNTIKTARSDAGSTNSKDCINQAFEKVDEAVDLSIGLLDCLPIVPGTYDVITDPTITGLIAHEAFGYDC